MTSNAESYANWISPAALGVDRETYDADACLVPEISTLGWSYFAEADSLEQHSHPGAWEICYLVKGSTTWWVGNDIFEVQPDHLFITRPDEPHGGVDGVMHPCELFWVIVTPNHNPHNGEALTRLLESVRARTWRAHTTPAAYFKRLLMEMRNPHDHAHLIVRAALESLIVDACRCASGDHVQRRRISRNTARVEAAKEWMAAHLEVGFDTATVARSAGLKPTQFREVFQQETGFSPQNYFNRLRNRRAQQYLIETRIPVTEIAHRLGYHSSQHFAGSFRRHTGFTPTQYRERHIS